MTSSIKWIFAALIALPMESYGAWFVAYPDATHKQIPITDSPYEFQMDGIRCDVKETKFLRAPNDSIMEVRELGCWTSDSVYVYTLGNCANRPHYSITTLGIKNKGKHYVPALVCGPKDAP